MLRQTARQEEAVVAVFAVTTARGPNWQPELDTRAQPDFDRHAAFVNGLVDQGVIVVGGRIGTEQDEDMALLAVEIADEPALRSLFFGDPWVKEGVIRIREVRAWTLWLDPRGSRS
jgi:uncharacterized protein